MDKDVNEISKDVSELKNTVDRISAEIPLLALRRNAMQPSGSGGGNDKVKELIDSLRKDYSEYFRGEGRKADKKDFLPQIIGIGMFLVAFISAMVAILTPMNNERASAKAAFDKHIESEKQVWREHNADVDTQLTRLEDRIKEAVKDMGIRMEKIDDTIDKIKDGEVIDKAYNVKIDMLSTAVENLMKRP